MARYYRCVVSRGGRYLDHIAPWVAPTCAAVVLTAMLGGCSGELTTDTQPSSDGVPTLPTAGPNQPSVLSNELLIKLRPGAMGFVRSGRPYDTGIGSINTLNRRHRARGFERIAKPRSGAADSAAVFRWYRVTIDSAPQIVKVGRGAPEEVRLRELAAEYAADPRVEHVELNHVIHVAAVPDDPYYASSGSWGESYPDLWGIHRVNLEGAWDSTTGSAEIVVADIDTGVDRNHPDIAANVWVNEGEVPDNGVDDDGNGYVDDYYGWDWANNDNDPMDDHGHGTHTVGTIAGVGNNGTGVVGVNWTAKVMALKFLSAGGSGSLADGVSAIQYAADMGARVSSNSWGCNCQQEALDDAIRYAHAKGMVTVVAAGNSYGDALEFSPASADMAITVAASDASDRLASFSNRGGKIDVTAPGVDILSARAEQNNMCDESRTVGGVYCRVSGTSMATPHVAGLAALLLAHDPSLSNEEVRQLLRRGADDVGALGRDDLFGYGIINGGESLAGAAASLLSPVITSPRSRDTIFGVTVDFSGRIDGEGLVSYILEAGRGRGPSEWQTLLASSAPPSGGLLGTVPLAELSDGAYTFRLAATDGSGETTYFRVHDVEVDNFDVSITSPNTLMSLGANQVRGTAISKNGIPFGAYTLEWGEGEAPAGFSTSGITLANGGTTPVADGILGTWDTSGLTPNAPYTLRLRVTSPLGIEAATEAVVTLDADLVPGWPIAFGQAGWQGWTCEAHSALADLNGDGEDELVVLGTGGNRSVHAFTRDGVALPGFPVTLEAENHEFVGMPTVADLDADGQTEIAAYVEHCAYSGSWKLTYGYYLYVFREDGSVHPGWPVELGRRYASAYAPSAADLDGDGRRELIFTDKYALHALTVDAVELSPFPVAIDEGRYHTDGVTVADLDGDGQPEILFGRDDRVQVVDAAGQPRPGWPASAQPGFGYSDHFNNGLAVADLDADGTLEVFGLAYIPSNMGCYGCKPAIYAWRADGSLLSGYPAAVGTDWVMTDFMTPATSDIDGDGVDEVLLDVGFTYQLTTNGPEQVGSNHGARSQPALVDIGGDGSSESVSSFRTSSQEGKVQVSAADGATVWERSFPKYTRFDSPAVVASWGSNAYVVAMESGCSAENAEPMLYVWRLPGSTLEADERWPMYGFDAARSGRRSGPSSGGDDPPPDDPGDVTPPTAPQSLQATALSEELVELVWQPATDDVGVAGYDIYRNGEHLATIAPATSYSDGTVGPATIYAYYLEAFDEAGNRSTASNTAHTTTPGGTTPDTDPPTAPILQDAKVRGWSSVSLSWYGSSDNVGVAGYFLYRDGALVATTTGTTYEDLDLLPRTTYRYEVVAFDEAGNASAPSNAVDGSTKGPSPKAR